MSRERDRFLAGVAHDLRQPLTVIDLAARLLVRHSLEPRSRELVARILEGVQQLGDLTAELLEVGDAGSLSREPVNLQTLVEGVIRGYPGRELSLAIDPDVVGHWDRRRILRIVQNLFENAFAHSQPRDQVTVSGAREGGRVTLRIENPCREVREERLAQLFQSFPRSDQRGRAGLGLYIARELARAHGGDVRVSLQDGVMAFLLRLPIAEAEGHDVLERPRRHPRGQLHSQLDVMAGGHSFRVQGRDLSQRGLAFFTQVPLAVSDRIHLAVNSPAASFSVLGTVRHIEEKRGDAVVGVEFPSELSAAELELLKKSS